MRDRSKNPRPLQKGRNLSIEAIQTMQALKRAKKNEGSMEQVFDSKFRRLLKLDMMAVLKDLLRQNECLFALKVCTYDLNFISFSFSICVSMNLSNKLTWVLLHLNTAFLYFFARIGLKCLHIACFGLCFPWRLSPLSFEPDLEIWLGPEMQTFFLFCDVFSIEWFIVSICCSCDFCKLFDGLAVVALISFCFLQIF